MAGSRRPREREASFDLSGHQRLRVALVSDTHGVLDERIAALVDDCDLALHAGDVGDAGVLTQLQALVSQTIAVRGNNDTPRKWPGDQHDVLRTMPDQGRVALPGGLLVVVHGHRFDPVAQRHDRLRAAFSDARVIVYGHSHRQVFDHSAQPWIINPGAAGRARTFGGPSCAILTTSRRQWTVSEHRFT